MNPSQEQKCVCDVPERITLSGVFSEPICKKCGLPIQEQKCCEKCGGVYLPCVNPACECHAPQEQKPVSWRSELEKIAWKHYDPEASINVEGMLDEMCPKIQNLIAKAKSEGGVERDEELAMKIQDAKSEVVEYIEKNAVMMEMADGKQHYYISPEMLSTAKETKV